MLSKKQATLIQSLRSKKFRQKYNLFVAEGIKTVQTILQSKHYKINTIYHTLPSLSMLEINHEINQVSIDERMMKSISFLNTPSPILALVETLALDHKKWQKGIYLDDVQDPGNVGTIIRIADWFGMDAVIRSSGSADFYNPKVIQSTMGAFANIQLLEMDSDELLSNQSNFIAADMDGEDLSSFQSSSEYTLILGSEGKGLSTIFKNHTDVKKVTINGHENKISESLNVSVATGIICASLSISN